MQQGVGAGGICVAAALLPPPKLLSCDAPLPPLPAIPLKAMAFFLLIQANDMEQNVFSLCPEVQNHTGSTGKVSQGKDFPPAPKEPYTEEGSSTSPAPSLLPASPRSAHVPSRW